MRVSPRHPGYVRTTWDETSWTRLSNDRSAAVIVVVRWTIVTAALELGCVYAAQQRDDCGWRCCLGVYLGRTTHD